MALSVETKAAVVAYYGFDNPPSNTQNRLNHDDCPAGVDTRRRLYSTVTPDGRKILLHCFNCGGSGVINLKPHVHREGSLSSWDKAPVFIEAEETFKKWQKVYGEARSLTSTPLEGPYMDKWPHTAIRFIDETVEFNVRNWYGMRRRDNGSVILPCGDWRFDIRYPDKSFLRVVHPSHSGESNILIYNSKGSKTGVVCEDPLSAMKLDIAGYAGIALCGTSLPEVEAAKIATLYKDLVVWLDNDSPTVIAAAEAARSRLALYRDNVGLVNSTFRDPKNYAVTDLPRIITKGSLT
jgi:hypothetical protein